MDSDTFRRLWRDRVRRPVDVPGINARTDADWATRQARSLARRGLTAFETPLILAAYVGAGAWRVRCRCGDAPPADPDWQIARCLGCGAIYRGVVFPPDRAAIEAELLRRPRLATRNWAPGEPVEALILENITHRVDTLDQVAARTAGRDRV